MVFLIGLNFSDRLLVTKALTSLYGISMTSSASAVRAPSHYPAGKAASAVAASSKAQPTSTSTSTNTNANTSQSSAYTPPPPSSARHSLLSRLMAKHHIHPTATMGSLSDATVQALSQSLSELTIENDLRRKMREDIARLVATGTYRGNRHVRGLPVRGQRTRTQIATARKLNKVERRG